MTINGIGVDIEDVGRFRKVPDSFLLLVFTSREIEYCKKKKKPYLSFAGRFCAKEAIIKAYEGKISVKDIEILNKPSGSVKVYIKGKYMKNLKCSISHSEKQAIAFVIID